MPLVFLPSNGFGLKIKSFWLIVLLKLSSKMIKVASSCNSREGSFNFNILEKNKSINSTYNGVAFTVDMIDDNPDKVRILSLRSFGESLYHSLTDASLEFGYKSI